MVKETAMVGVEDESKWDLRLEGPRVAPFERWRVQPLDDGAFGVAVGNESVGVCEKPLNTRGVAVGGHEARSIDDLACRDAPEGWVGWVAEGRKLDQKLRLGLLRHILRVQPGAADRWARGKCLRGDPSLAPEGAFAAGAHAYREVGETVKAVWPGVVGGGLGAL